MTRPTQLTASLERLSYKPRLNSYKRRNRKKWRVPAAYAAVACGGLRLLEPGAGVLWLRGLLAGLAVGLFLLLYRQELDPLFELARARILGPRGPGAGPLAPPENF